MRKTLKQWRMLLSVIHKSNPMGIPALFVGGFVCGYVTRSALDTHFPSLIPVVIIVCITLSGIFCVIMSNIEDAHHQLVLYCTSGDVERVKFLTSIGLKVSKGKYKVFKIAVGSGDLKMTNVLRKAAGKNIKCHNCIIRSTCLELCEDFKK